METISQRKIIQLQLFQKDIFITEKNLQVHLNFILLAGFSDGNIWKGPRIAFRRDNQSCIEEKDAQLIKHISFRGVGKCEAVPLLMPLGCSNLCPELLYHWYRPLVETTAYNLIWLKFNGEVKRFGFDIKFTVELPFDIWKTFKTLFGSQFSNFCMIR